MSEHPAQEPRETEEREVRVELPSAAPKVAYAILGLTVFVYLGQILSVALFGYAVGDLDWLQVLGGRINSAILAGQLWRFVTPVFLHFSFQHIFFNMYALLSIGSFMERQLGGWRFFLLYFLGGFAGNVFSFLFTREGVSAGASGAIFALAAAEGVFFYQNRRLFGGQARRALGNTAFIVAINIFLGMSLGFDNWGHIGGLLGGGMFAWLGGTLWELAGTPPVLHLRDLRESREIWNAAGITLILFGALALLGMFLKVQ